MGAYALDWLNTAKERQPLIGDVRGQGLMIGAELVKDPASKEPAAAEAAQVRAYCRERGVLIGVGGQFGNVLRVQPPLVITREQLDRALATIDEALTALTPASTPRSAREPVLAGA